MKSPRLRRSPAIATRRTAAEGGRESSLAFPQARDGVGPPHSTSIRWHPRCYRLDF